MTIFVVYEAEPKFPATDQNPSATRFQVDKYWVDATAQPTLQDVQAFLTPAPTPPTPLEWFNRLSAPTQANVVAAAVANPQLMLLLLKAAGVSFIDLTDTQTIAGVQAMVDAGILTAQEQTTLMTP